jgi:hypothetical protein
LVYLTSKPWKIEHLPTFRKVLRNLQINRLPVILKALRSKSIWLELKALEKET